MSSVTRGLSARAASRQTQGCNISRGFHTSARNYSYLPSVEHLIHEQGIPMEEVEKIPGSGPNGRLLKGDVLAYMGRIEKSYLAEQSERLSKLGHLDLSNIKIKQPQKETAPSQPAPVEAPPVPDTEVAVPVSLTTVLDCQKRIQDTLGIFLPLSTFIARAVEMANEGLPRSKTAKPSADDLFDAVLGLDKVASPKTFRGNFTPQVTALPPAPPMSAKKDAASKKPDILDLLAAKRTPLRASKSLGIMPTLGVTAANVFSVSVPKGEEKTAKVFLERVKTVLEAEPGRLVL